MKSTARVTARGRRIISWPFIEFWATVAISWRQLLSFLLSEVITGRFQPFGMKAREEPCGCG